MSSKILPINEFFQAMRLSKNEKKRREDLAEELFDLFQLFFTEIEAEKLLKMESDNEITIENVKQSIDAEKYKEMLTRQYNRKVEVYIVLVAALLYAGQGENVLDEVDVEDINLKTNINKGLSDELTEDIKQRISDIVDTTIKNLDGDDYFLSDDRATLLGENETNFVCNTIQYESALDEGYTKKQWLTMKDEKVRDTHFIVDNQIIGINEYFYVGNSEMLYPMDMSRGASPEEVINCRCSLRYIQ